MAMSAARKYILKPSVVRTVSLRIMVVVLSAYGIYAFVHRQFSSNIFLQSRFVFFDFNEPVIAFIIDYLAIMFLFTCVGYYIAKILRSVSAKRLQQEI